MTSWFSNLFKKEEPLPPADLSILKTDLHSHFIPGIDDGSQNMDETIALLTEMQALGYTKVVTTPHIMIDYYRNTPEIILGGLEKVREKLETTDLTIKIDAAAEYYLDHSFLDLIQEGKLLTFGDNYVLFELPFISEPPIVDDAIFQLQIAGYKPVLAHAERYGFYYENYERYQEFIDKEVILQLNINSLTGHYSPATKEIAERMINDDLFQFIGSDCHNLHHIDVVKSSLTEKSMHKILSNERLLNHTL